MMMLLNLSIKFLQGNFSLWVRGINASNCKSELLQVDYEVLEQPEITATYLNNSTSDSQFEFQSTILLTWDSVNQTAYRILKDNIQIFPVSGFEVSQNNSYTITTLATALDNGNYSIEIINEECTTSENRDVFIFESGLEIIHTKPENEVTDIDDFGNQIIYIDLEQDEYLGFYTLLDESIYEHTWYFGDTHTNIGSEVIHFYNEEGLYTVSVDIKNTITNVLTTIQLDQTIRVNEFQGAAVIDNLNPGPDNTFQFYPNPVQQKLHLDLSLNSEQPVVLRIYTITGIVLFVEQFNGLQEEHTYIWNNPLYNAAGGGAVYIAELTFGDTRKTFKLIKN